MAEKVYKLVFQEWEESERGWGTRPDGYSLHIDLVAHARYVKRAAREQAKFFTDQGLPANAVPDEYTRPCGGPREVEVDRSLYNKVKKVTDLRSWDRVKISRKLTLVTGKGST